ncbi:hypothetical protein PENTCL1PPCAC_8504, partial [Pristionchus entomophagus]
PARKKSEHVARRLVSLLKLVSTLSNCVPSNHGPVSDRGIDESQHQQLVFSHAQQNIKMKKDSSGHS